MLTLSFVLRPDEVVVNIAPGTKPDVGFDSLMFIKMSKMSFFNRSDDILDCYTASEYADFLENIVGAEVYKDVQTGEFRYVVFAEHFSMLSYNGCDASVALDPDAPKEEHMSLCEDEFFNLRFRVGGLDYDLSCELALTVVAGYR